MSRRMQLTERQLDVLRWVAAGCPDQDSGNAQKVSARSLQSRGLVDVSRRTGSWHATLTEDGQYYLDHGHPRPQLPRREARRPKRERPADVERPPMTGEPAGHQERPPSALLEIPATDLLERLRSGGGQLTVVAPSPDERAAWRRAIDAVRREGLVPEGQHLRHQGRDRGDLVIELRDGPHPQMAAVRSRPERLPLPETVEHWHPLADADFDGISDDQQPRARRLLHTLATAAEKEGLTAARGEGQAIVFQLEDQSIGFRFYEELDVRDVVPDEADGKRYAWQRVRPVSQEVPSGRLCMQFDHDWQFSGRRRNFADRKRWRLEDRLADVLAEVRFRLDEQVSRQQTAEREKQDRERAWQQAMEKARADFHESRRVAALERQLADLDKSTRVRAYCDELEAAENAEATAEWVAWARCYADRLDPRRRADLMPPDVEPRPEDLKPFLGRWSPYGPTAR